MADPGNVQWQWDVVISHWRLAERGNEPVRHWTFIIATMRKLKGENRLRPDWARFLPIAEARLAELQQAQALSK